MTKLILASRQSILALRQSNHIKQLLQRKFPELSIEIVGVSTKGDQNLDSNLKSMGGKGAFVSEIERMILDGDADFAIHSMKDVPVVRDDELEIQSVGHRENVADCVVSSHSMHDLPSDAKIGTASGRRQALLSHLYKKTNIQLVRGNIQTRLRKFDTGQFDALILATAGLVRLSLESRIREYLDPLSFVPAAGQGVLAAQFRTDDKRMTQWLGAIQNTDVEDCVTIERQLVGRLGGDCSMAAGVYCKRMDSIFDLSCIVLNAAGTRSIRLRKKHKDANSLVDQASEELLNMGAEELVHGS